MPSHLTITVEEPQNYPDNSWLEGNKALMANEVITTLEDIQLICKDNEYFYFAENQAHKIIKPVLIRMSDVVIKLNIRTTEDAFPDDITHNKTTSLNFNETTTKSLAPISLTEATTKNALLNLGNETIEPISFISPLSNLTAYTSNENTVKPKDDILADLGFN